MMFAVSASGCFIGHSLVDKKEQINIPFYLKVCAFPWHQALFSLMIFGEDEVLWTSCYLFHFIFMNTDYSLDILIKKPAKS